MFTVYFAEKACQKIGDFYRVSRPIFDHLFKQVRLLETAGIPVDALLVSDLVDIKGQPVVGYLTGLGEFSLVISREGEDILIVWEVHLRVADD